MDERFNIDIISRFFASWESRAENPALFNTQQQFSFLEVVNFFPVRFMFLLYSTAGLHYQARVRKKGAELL